MEKRVWIFWGLAVLGFPVTLLLSMSVGLVSHHEKDIILDLSIEPGVFYRSGAQFAVSQNPYGRQSFSYISTPKLLKKYQYLQFEKVDVDQQTVILLELKKGRKVLFSERFVHGEDAFFNLPWGDIKVPINEPIELLMTVVYEPNLGVNFPKRHDMSFNGINLLSDSFQARWQYFAAWLVNSPSYQLSSMNFWQKQGVPIQAAAGLMLWLTISLVAAWLLRINSKHVTAFLLVILLPMYLWVGVKQLTLNRQVNALYTTGDGNINLTDQRIYEFAQQVRAWSAQQKTQHVAYIVESFKAFEQSRMIYHLSELNVMHSINWSELDGLFNKKQLDSLMLVLPETVYPACEQSEALSKFDSPELVLRFAGYCLVKI